MSKVFFTLALFMSSSAFAGTKWSGCVDLSGQYLHSGTTPSRRILELAQSGCEKLTSQQWALLSDGSISPYPVTLPLVFVADGIFHTPAPGMHQVYRASYSATALTITPKMPIYAGDDCYLIHWVYTLTPDRHLQLSSVQRCRNKPNVELKIVHRRYN